MASRPFASIAVALEVSGDQEELLQVSMIQKTHRDRNKQPKMRHVTQKGNNGVMLKKHDAVSRVV